MNQCIHDRQATADVHRLKGDGARVADTRQEVQHRRWVQCGGMQSKHLMNQPQQVVETLEPKRLWEHFKEKLANRCFQVRNLHTIVR